MQPLAISQELSQKLANMAFIAALLVVAIHVREGSIIGSFNWHVYQIIVDGFARIAVPFFFLAAGFFLAGHCTGPGWWLRECKKRIKTLGSFLCMANPLGNVCDYAYISLSTFYKNRIYKY